MGSHRRHCLGWASSVLAGLVLGLPLATYASLVALPLEHFGDDDETQGMRRFSHSEHHLLEDGSEFVLEWKAVADPDEILGLDVHENREVKLLECRPNALLLS